MMNTVTLDVETKRWWEPGEKRDHGALGVSYLGIYEEASDHLHGFFEDEIDRAWPILEKAELIIGYNIIKFDYPVLNPYYRGELEKLPTFDLMVAVQDVLGHRLKLDHLARATLNDKKNRPGSEAIWLYEEGRLDELAEYCLNDVRLTFDLYKLARDGEPLKHLDQKGEEHEIMIDMDTFMSHRPETSQDDIQMSLEM